MNYYPSNTVARHATKLPQVIELEGDWEVALAETTVPSPLPNVTRDTHFFIEIDRNRNVIYDFAV